MLARLRLQWCSVLVQRAVISLQLSWHPVAVASDNWD